MVGLAITNISAAIPFGSLILLNPGAVASWTRNSSRTIRTLLLQSKMKERLDPRNTTQDSLKPEKLGRKEGSWGQKKVELYAVRRAWLRGGQSFSDSSLLIFDVPHPYWPLEEATQSIQRVSDLLNPRRIGGQPLNRFRQHACPSQA